MPVTLVTGTSTGIGYATALHFARRGHTVVATMRNLAKAGPLETAAREQALPLVIRELDVTRPESIERAVADTVAAEGPIDVLVNNAGVGAGEAVAELTTKKVDLQLAINLRSPILFYRECVDLLRAAGAEHRCALVVNTSSISGKSGEAWLSVYSATKAAFVGFTQAMHKELAGDGIKSTALCPAFVDTPMTDFVEGQINAEDMIQVSDVAEVVRVLLKMSPGCVVPEVQFLRPGDRL
jgi:NAD(P)-dependent dehydrogenase (short-subunit alcohol dehydrogenase family)